MPPQSALKGFHALPIQLCATDTSDTMIPARYVYFKRHQVRSNTPSSQRDNSLLALTQHNNTAADNDDNDNDDDESTYLRQGCTLFVLNIPSYYIVSDVVQLFSIFGQVETVLFQDEVHSSEASRRTPDAVADLDRKMHSILPPTRSAHVVFNEAQSVTNALTQELLHTRQPAENGSVRSGVSKWLAAYQTERPDPHALQQQVDRFMEAFDKRRRLEDAAREAGPVIDEDGFTLVTSKKRKRNVMSAVARAQQEANAAQSKKNKKKAESMGFYKFQRRQKQMQELAVLRQKFEEDKRRIAAQKARRQFKPF
jgi:ribosomal RNA-processing protein 7